MMIHEEFYYYLINKENTEVDLALTVAKVPNYRKACLFTLEEINHHHADQLFMLKKNIHGYQIYHCLSGLVVEHYHEKCQLHSSKNKDYQWYSIKPDGKDQNGEVQVWIEHFNKDVRKLYFSKTLICDIKDSGQKSTKWVLRKAIKNLIIQQSATIMFQHTALVLEIEDASSKQKALAVQNLFNGLFHQRWIFQAYEEFFLIKNVKSDLYLQNKTTKVKEGTIIQQGPLTKNPNQLWFIKERGQRTYSIHSSIDPILCITIDGNSLKEGTNAILFMGESRHVWRIVVDLKYFKF